MRGSVLETVARNVPKLLRWTVALLSLCAMVGLFLLPAAAGYAEGLTRLQLVPAIMMGSVACLVILVASVLLFGRLYCSVICPLGIAQDVVRACVAWVLPKRATKPMTALARAIRFTILAAFLLGVVFGLTGLIAPYGIFGRFLSVGVRRVGEPSAVVVAWSVGLFAFVMAMTLVRARWWCNRVCPVGTLLGLFARFAVFHVRIDGARCVKCGLCAKRCDKGALAVREDRTISVDPSLCVTCGNCVGTCRKEALKWR